MMVAPVLLTLNWSAVTGVIIGLLVAACVIGLCLRIESMTHYEEDSKDSGNKEYDDYEFIED